MTALGAIRGLDSALGLWADRRLEVREEWAAGLPAGTRGALTGDHPADHARLDGAGREARRRSYRPHAGHTGALRQS
ncbi:hypothetical protein [Streptomyces lutosisoli]|uniref:Uncharacterized protein n=1 Tax=Streptomyces lutosisoli TaxID=2665721 RepID=A0ABW2VD90_9ACTN